MGPPPKGVRASGGMSVLVASLEAACVDEAVQIARDAHEAGEAETWADYLETLDTNLEQLIGASK